MCPAENHPPCQALGVMDAMERITRAISGGDAGNGQVGAVLDVMLDVFDADRAWLLAEREGEPEVWDALAERTRSAWPGVLAAAAELRADAFHRDLIAAARRTGRPVAALRPDRQSPVAEQFTIRSELMTVVSPHGRPALLVGLHHCRRACRYDDVEGLFFVVASRLADALATQWALAARRQSEERFRILVEHAPEAIVILDATSGLFVDANEGASRLFGVARDELIDRAGPADFSPVQQPDGRPSPAAAMEWIGRAVAGEAPTFEWTHRSRQGQDIPCEISLVRLPDSERTLVRGTMVDITQRKRAEREGY